MQNSYTVDQSKLTTKISAVDTHMEILVVTTLFDTRLKTPWICNLVATLLHSCKHLVTTLKIIHVFTYVKVMCGFYTPEVSNTHI